MTDTQALEQLSARVGMALARSGLMLASPDFMNK